MNQNYIIPNQWSIIEEGFEAERVRSSESLFSLGNGAMGQRANFEENYTGETFQGSYIAGIYYPDKTRVGWWKNGYPEYFAKVLNAPNWIGIHVEINNEILDLATCKSIENYRRELNMKEGWYKRSFEAVMIDETRVKVESIRFLSLQIDELGAIRYSVTPLNREAKITFIPYIDAGIENEDTNWEEKFWEPIEILDDELCTSVTARTLKTRFEACTYMHNELAIDSIPINIDKTIHSKVDYIAHSYTHLVAVNSTFTLFKYGGYVTSLNHDRTTLREAAEKVVSIALEAGFDKLLAQQREAWDAIWQMADITIEGDVKAQQGIRFNIFQLNQTYLGKDDRLNIGPKGFTGEKYGGSTYWDTEAYCIPFYMATKDEKVARSLLKYRYNHLEKAIENAEKLGFTNGAALYPMVTMNGEECHNEWEITFEEIHRNGAISFAIFNYLRYTGDYLSLIHI